jgi:serine protease Do
MNTAGGRFNSTMKRHRQAILARGPLFGLAIALPLASSPAWASPPSVAEQSPVATATQLGMAFSQVAERVSPSVVSIQVEVSRPQPSFGFQFPFGGFGGGQEPGVQRGSGSGVIVTEDGGVLTNNHVVEHAQRITVALQDGRRFPAKVVGVDPATDLAVLRIEAKGLTAARFGDSDAAQVGQWLVAIGSPFGLDYSVTTGVLSAKGRGGLGANEIEDYLQTDASINPGNSGGPLVNLQGEVLGINTMIIGHASGIGFAIPSNLARKVGMELLQKGNVSRAWIGVSYQELTPELASSFGVQRTRGALVNEVVPNGPAAKAGIRSGDILLDIEGREVREGRDLMRAVLQYPVGQPLSVTVLREGQQKKLSVVTTARPDAREAKAASGTRKQRGHEEPGAAGAALAALTPELARRIDYSGPGGVVVTGVVPGSAADRAGLTRGDVIEEVNRRPVQNERQVEEALEKGKTLLRLQRQGGTFYAAVGD